MIKYIDFTPDTDATIVAFILEYGNRIINAFLSEYQSLSNIDLSGMSEWEIPICVERINTTGVSESMKQRILQEIRENL